MPVLHSALFRKKSFFVFCLKQTSFFLKNDMMGFKNMKKVKILILHYFSIFKALCAVSSKLGWFCSRLYM